MRTKLSSSSSQISDSGLILKCRCLPSPSTVQLHIIFLLRQLNVSSTHGTVFNFSTRSFNPQTDRQITSYHRALLRPAATMNRLQLPSRPLTVPFDPFASVMGCGVSDMPPPFGKSRGTPPPHERKCSKQWHAARTEGGCVTLRSPGRKVAGVSSAWSHLRRSLLHGRDGAPLVLMLGL